MATRRKTNADIGEPEPLGKEGETCAQCGTKLAVDQRYCLNCGTARAEPRLDYERHLPEDGTEAASGKSSSSTMQWSPLLAIVAIAILGVMLLLGVLIGQDNGDVTITQVPGSTASTATATTQDFPTTTTPTTTPTTTAPEGGRGTTVPDTGTTTAPQGTGKDGAAGGIAPND